MVNKVHKQGHITAPYFVLHNHPYIVYSCSRRYLSKSGCSIYTQGQLCVTMYMQGAVMMALFMHFVYHCHPYIFLITTFLPDKTQYSCKTMQGNPCTLKLNTFVMNFSTYYIISNTVSLMQLPNKDIYMLFKCSQCTWHSVKIIKGYKLSSESTHSVKLTLPNQLIMQIAIFSTGTMEFQKIIDIQHWNLNNPVTNGPVVLGCNI